MSKDSLIQEQILLPKFPRTKHLPIEPHATRDDLIATTEELKYLLGCGRATIEEKVDGSNCGMSRSSEGYPIIRNRSHILNKAYTGSKTPAKLQFSSVWTWWYDHYKCFELLEELAGYMPSVYGEWLYAKHTVDYTLLPDRFIAFDLYDWRAEKFYAPRIAKAYLEEAGFSTIPTLASYPNLTVPGLLEYRDQPSSFTSEKKQEGIYIKIDDGLYMTHRYKMVNPEFVITEHWNNKPLIKNGVIK